MTYLPQYSQLGAFFKTTQNNNKLIIICDNLYQRDQRPNAVIKHEPRKNFLQVKEIEGGFMHWQI